MKSDPISCDPGYLAEVQANIRALEQRMKAAPSFPPLALVSPPSDGGDTENTVDTENETEHPSRHMCLCVASQLDPFLTAILTTAKQCPAPEAADYYLPAMQLLVSVCWVLQLAAGARPFYLSCRVASCMVDVTFQQSAKYLRKLCRDELLERVSKGAKESGMASQYLYHERERP